jgi:hypothetical protein
VNKKFLFIPFFGNNNCISFYRFSLENLEKYRSDTAKNSLSSSLQKSYFFLSSRSQKVMRKIKTVAVFRNGYFVVTGKKDC